MSAAAPFGVTIRAKFIGLHSERSRPEDQARDPETDRTKFRELHESPLYPRCSIRNVTARSHAFLASSGSKVPRRFSSFKKACPAG